MGDKKSSENQVEHCTVKEAASLVGCADKTIRRWVTEGRLRASRPVARGSSRLLIDKESLFELLQWEP